MNVLIREDLRELAIHWAIVLADERRLTTDGVDRVLACVREEFEILSARRGPGPELGHGPVRPRKPWEVGHG